MAHFIGKVQGNRGVASRLGSVSSGIEATINGWNLGIEVIARVEEGKDVFLVYKTSGSNGHKQSEFIGKFVE